MRKGIAILFGIYCLVFMCTPFSGAAELENHPSWRIGAENMPEWNFEGLKYHGYPAGLNPLFENQKVIDAWGWSAKDVDEIKDLLPGPFYDMVKHPEIWGPIRINETEIIPWKGNFLKYMEAAEKYRGTCKVGKDMGLLNYKAGRPFPDTEDPVELIWNFIMRHWSDNFFYTGVFSIIDRDGGVRLISPANMRFYFSGRLVNDPKPLYAPNPKDLEFIESFPYLAPYDLKGTAMVTYRYLSQEKADDMWVYSPYLRRVRRMSTAQRQDRLPGGLDQLWENFYMFAGKPSGYTWSYKGRQEMLTPRNSSIIPQIADGCYLAGMNNYYQKVNTYVLEAVPHVKSSVSKLVLWIDPITFVSTYGLVYDIKGRPWLMTVYQHSADGDWNLVIANFTGVDLQRQHATRMYLSTVVDNLPDKKPEDYTMEAIRRTYPAR